MPATEQDIQDARLEVLKEERYALRDTPYRTVAELAVAILNDKHAGTGRDVQKAVDEALAVYKAVVKGMAVPDFFGPAA
jgi:hypothetical protein